jgi:hypothetical protein
MCLRESIEGESTSTFAKAVEVVALGVHGAEKLVTLIGLRVSFSFM